MHLTVDYPGMDYSGRTFHRQQDGDQVVARSVDKMRLHVRETASVINECRTKIACGK